MNGLVAGASVGAVCVFLACLLTACADQQAARGTAAAPAPSSTSAAAPLDASYDWRRMVLMPFGTVLKSSSVPLHEVLLFHDDAQGVSSELGRDCFGIDGDPPRLFGSEPREFLLCFSHDRLNRIEATVPVQAGEGAIVLDRACSLWLGRAVAADSASASGCEGHDGSVAFSAHLAGTSGELGEAREAATAPDRFEAVNVVLVPLAELGAASEH